MIVEEALPENEANDEMEGMSLSLLVGNVVELADPDSDANAVDNGLKVIKAVDDSSELTVAEMEFRLETLVSGDCDTVTSLVLVYVTTGVVVNEVVSVKEVDADTAGDKEADTKDDVDMEMSAEAEALLDASADDEMSAEDEML